MKSKNANMNLLYAAMTTIIFGVFLDQVTKIIAINNLANNTITIIPNFLRFELAYNTGMAFGLFQNARIIFIVLTVAILVWGWKYYQEYFEKSKWFYWGGILFFAGTLGNFLDRLFYGKVTDFIAVNFGSYNFPIFNIADSLLTISVVVIMIAVYIYEKNQTEVEHNNGNKK